MAEWLRRLTRNQIPSGSVGSNPTDCEKLFLLALPSYTVSQGSGGLTSRNVGSVVECSPATRAARVRFPDVADFSCSFLQQRASKESRKVKRD